MTMNRSDSNYNNPIHSKVTDKIQSGATFSLASAVKMFLRDDAQVNHNSNNKVRKTATAAELRENATNPFKRMQLRILGLKRGASPRESADDCCYHTVYPRKMISLGKKQERVTGLRSHTFNPPTHYSKDARYRTVHPKKVVALEKMHDRIDGLKHHSSPRLQAEDLFHRAVHPNMMTIDGTEAVSKNSYRGAAKSKRLQQELFRQDDMIKSQGRGLQKKYQLIHSDLGKLLRSTQSGSPCSSASSSPVRYATSSA